MVPAPGRRAETHGSGVRLPPQGTVRRRRDQATTPKPPVHEIFPGGEADLEESEGLELAGAGQRTGIDDLEATGRDRVGEL